MVPFVFISSELKRRMKAQKKAEEKAAKESAAAAANQPKSTPKVAAQDDETIDPNVSGLWWFDDDINSLAPWSRASKNSFRPPYF